MADQAPEVKVKLTAEDTGVAAAIKELGVQLKNLKQQEQETAASALSLGSALRGIAAAGAFLQIGLIGKSAFDSAVNIGKMADKTGLTTQTLSVFHKTADDVGVATESVDKALVKAAKSITQFEQGSKTAAQGFALIGIKAKDFEGLSPDQKIQLVTTKLGGMAAGFNRTTAAQLIFSKGGADAIPVLEALAAQGFDKAYDSASRLGLLLSRDMTDAAQSAKASIQELQDVGAGMATQFEAGLLPAVSDVGEAFSDSLTQGGVKFEDLGRYAGNAVRAIAAGFIALGETIGTVLYSIYSLGTAVWAGIKNDATTQFEALGQAAHGHFLDAFHTLGQGAKSSTAIVSEEIDRQKAIYGTLKDSILSDYANLFPSAEEEARRAKARIANLRPDKTTPEEAPPKLDTGLADSAAKARLSLEEQQLQDELTLRRAYAKQNEDADKAALDQGLLTLQAYFDKRRDAARADAADEVSILTQQRNAAQAAADAAGKEKSKAATPKEADTIEARQIAELQKVEEYNTRIAEAKINSQTKIASLDGEQFDKTKANQQEILDFQKELDELQGKRSQAATAEVDAAVQKRTIELQQAGQSSEQIDAEIAQYRQLKQAVADYELAKSKTSTDTKSFDIQKQSIQIKAKAGEISPLEEERQINQLIKDRLPLLQADAQAELSGAQKTGNVDNVAAAQNTVAQIQNLGQASNKLGQEVAGALSQDFSSFFETVGRGTKSVAQSFEALAGSVVASIEKILEKQLLLKILGSGAPGGGGLLGALHLPGLGAAEGGLIKGPGGPKADAIPARLSAGEFVVKADAVNAFGAHNLDAINRGLQPPSFSSLNLPKFAEGGLVGAVSSPGAGGDIKLGISLDHGLILQTLSSKDASRIVLQHLTNNPKAASKALGRSQG